LWISPRVFEAAAAELSTLQGLAGASGIEGGGHGSGSLSEVTLGLESNKGSELSPTPLRPLDTGPAAEVNASWGASAATTAAAAAAAAAATAKAPDVALLPAGQGTRCGILPLPFLRKAGALAGRRTTGVLAGRDL